MHVCRVKMPQKVTPSASDVCSADFLVSRFSTAKRRWEVASKPCPELSSTRNMMAQV